MSEFSSAAFRQGTHKVPEKIISFKGREIDEMEDDESDQGTVSGKKKSSNKFEGYEDYYKDYQDYGEDYYLPQENFQVESERSTDKHRQGKPQRIRKEADEFKWYLPHAKKP